MARKHLTDLERFHGSYKKDGDCWRWQLAHDRDGYGLFKVGSRRNKTRQMARAHRWAYEALVASIPAGKVIDHLCRCRDCVNPSHLEPVTPAVNTKRGSRANASHCKYGHSFSGENLIVDKHGRRACRACANARSLAFGKQTGWAAQKKYKEAQNRLGG